MIHTDFETRSEADIQAVGARNYSEHPSTDILCMSFGEDKLTTVDSSVNKECPDELAYAVKSGELVNAFNTPFECAIWTNILTPRYGWPLPKPEQWRDTQAKCLGNGFPASLDKAAKALRLEEQKEGGGKALINFFSVPVSNGKLKGQFRNPADHPERFAEFMAYCEQDVRTTIAIEKALPDLSPDELAFWQNTWRLNERGIYVDRDLINALKRLTDTTRAEFSQQLSEATGGVITIQDITNHGKLLRYCNDKGLQISSIAKKVLKPTLEMDLPGPTRVVLEARQALGKSSTSKLDSTLLLTSPDSRVRGVFRHHGAATGRDSSWLQTLPRGEKMPADELSAAALEGDTEKFLSLAYKKEGSKKVYDPMGAIITCLRGCFCAKPGHTFVQCDWSAVEPRIVAWLAGEDEVLDDFRNFDQYGGADTYQRSAAIFYGCEPLDIKGDARQLGKVYELQNIYESGWQSVQRSAKDQYRISIDEDTARLLVDVFRSKRHKTVAFWRASDTAAKNATACPGSVYRVGKIAFCHDGKHLRMRLPSGRKVTYPFATLEPTLTPFGKWVDQVNYWGVHSTSKTWMKFSLHGGVYCNTATQGTGGCLMRNAAIKLEEETMDVVLRAHDEMVCEVPELDAEADAAKLKRIMLTQPEWAKDLPLNGGGWINKRFTKQ